MRVDPALEVKIPDRAPECLQCGHFEVSWDPSFPRACRLFGIKSRNQPSMEVFLSTGKHCFAFEAREGLKEPDSPPAAEKGRWA
jgi:hypothetical protein